MHPHIHDDVVTLHLHGVAFAAERIVQESVLQLASFQSSDRQRSSTPENSKRYDP